MYGNSPYISREIILQRPHLELAFALGGDGFGDGEDAGERGVVGDLLHQRGLADGFDLLWEEPVT